MLAVLVAMLLLVDVNHYRDRIEQQVSRAFEREVILGGQLALQPSLTPRFTVNGLKIANPDWTSRPFLASVSQFDIRVNLLPLLRGELEILSLEFHGVDLLLEESTSGANNFTFGDAGEPSTLPSIQHLLLQDASIGFKGPDGPVRQLHLTQVTARKVPGQPVELEAETILNTVPLALSLRAQPRDERQPAGPWQVSLSGKVGDLNLRLSGSVAEPTGWHQGEFQLAIQGQHLTDLESLSGYPLPVAKPVALDATIRLRPDESVQVEDIEGHIGASDLRGILNWYRAVPRPAIRLQLASRQLDTTEWEFSAPLTEGTEQTDTTRQNQPGDIAALAGFDLDAGIRIERLIGQDWELQDVQLSAKADRQRLVLDIENASIEDTQVTATASLPWGEQLSLQEPGPVRPDRLLQHLVVTAGAEISDSHNRFATEFMGRPHELQLSSAEASARPGRPLTIRARGKLNDSPVSASLQGEPIASLLQRPAGPWQDLALEVRSDAVHLDATGSVRRPFQSEGLDLRFALSGPDLEALLPLQGSWSASGHYIDRPGHHVVDELKVRIGRSDIHGWVALQKDGPRPLLLARLDAGQLHIDELLQESGPGNTAADRLDEPLDIRGLTALDLDLETRIGRLEGLARPVRDMQLSARASGQRLRLAPARVSVDGIDAEAQVSLPWGEHLDARLSNDVTPRRLLQQADLALQLKSPAGALQHEIIILGHPMQLGFTNVSASASPGTPLQVTVLGRAGETPLQASLGAEPLDGLLQRPEGPWEDLALEIQGGDVHLQARGRVERPLEARGFDIRYTLRGEQIEALLPIFDFVLPLEGAYSLTGHFADLPDRTVFDELRIVTGHSDLSGSISVFQGTERPRLVANLQSEQVYLEELLPVSDTQPASGGEVRIIPDYDLPVERLREIDGELHFRGKQLRTTAGDLGDIRFTATLQDGVFKLDPFSVRGWAGARIESDMHIDASREPPAIEWNWIARELNYGVLLKQAGLAETVEGTLDITLQLSGNGRTRREFLGNASGQLIIVGQEGRLGSRRLDLWGSSLITTMLSPDWHREDVTEINCLVARISIEDGVAASDDLLADTRRITIGAAGTLDLENEELSLVIAPRPKRASLLSLTSPVHVTGPLAAPEVAVTVLPRNRMAAAGTGLLAGLINPGYLLFAFAQTGTGADNTCAAAVNDAMIAKGRADEVGGPPAESAPARFSLLPGCARSGQRRSQ